MADSPSHDVVLVGANVAVLVAALDLVRAGKRVALATDDRPLGGHFHGVRAGGLDFDVGRVTVERAGPEVRSSSAPLPDGAQSWAVRGAEVDEVLVEHLPGLHRTPTPESHVLGRRWPDHVTANRLDVVADPRLPDPPRTGPQHELHARRKLLPGAYDSASYAEAAAANHGLLHHVLFEPLVQKVLGVPSSAFLARSHRFAYTPLYWSETLQRARRAKASAAGERLPEYPFYAPRSGFTGELTVRLEAALRSHAGASWLEAPVDHLLVDERGCAVTAGGATVHGRRSVLGVSAARAAELLGVPSPPMRPGNGVTVVLARVRASDIKAETSCLYLCDPRDAAYRITDQEVLGGGDAEWHRVVIEGAGGGGGSGDGSELADSARHHLGLDDPRALEVLRVITLPRAKPIPTAGLLRAEAEESSRLAGAAPGAMFTGSLLHHGAAALNEQIARGKEVADALAV